MRAASQSSPLTPTPPFQAPPPSFPASRGPKQRQRRPGSGPPTPPCGPLTPHAPVECPRRGEGLSYLGVRRLSGVPACEGRGVRVVARVCRGATVYSALHPLPCTLLVVDVPVPVAGFLTPLVQASRLLPGVGGLSAVVLDRLCLPLSLGRGKPGGSLDFSLSCRFLTPPTRPLPPLPPEPSPWLRTSRATRLRMRTPPGCFAPRAVDFSGMLGPACEGLTETCGMTGCFCAARFSTGVRAFSASGGVLGWWDGSGGCGMVRRVEDSVEGEHCAGRARPVSICCASSSCVPAVRTLLVYDV